MAYLTINNAEFLWFLVLIIWVILTHLFISSKIKRKSFLFANFEALKRVTYSKERATSKTNKVSLNFDILFVRVLAILFFVFALANPVLWYEGEVSDLNYVLAIDSSSSMLADDFVPNRFEVARQLSKFFLNRVKEIRAEMGIVSFAGSAIIVSPLSADYDRLGIVFDGLEISRIPGTDLGQAIITSVNLVVASGEPGVVVLVTDGRPTVGTQVEEAVYYAQDAKVPIHTIGVGTEEGGVFIKAGFSRLDEEALAAIAEKTGGTFFRAENRDEFGEAMRDVFDIKKGQVPFDLSVFFLILGLLLVVIEWGIL
ncbi:MAG TPA: VWA domain-containing protein, partial [Candidatus Woesearchaeota archaeon]|nr:VWA domain-containing protein [Candidatus Woesearchaeota archaeon]